MHRQELLQVSMYTYRCKQWRNSCRWWWRNFHEFSNLNWLQRLGKEESRLWWTHLLSQVQIQLHQDYFFISPRVFVGMRWHMVCQATSNWSKKIFVISWNEPLNPGWQRIQYVRTNEEIAELHIQFILGACLLQVSILQETCFFKCLHTTRRLPLPFTRWWLAGGAGGAAAIFSGRWSMMQAKTGCAWGSWGDGSVQCTGSD